MDKIVTNIEKVEEMENINEQLYNQKIMKVYESITNLQTTLHQSMALAYEPYLQLANTISNMLAPYSEMYTTFERSTKAIANALGNIPRPILNIYSDDFPDEDKQEVDEVNEIIIKEIIQPDTEKKIHLEESPIITLSPVNDQVLKYLSENPDAIYQLSDMDFEIVMAEIYSKLGYDVTRTQSTRDGGKDIIIRKPELLGDFIYYVECKKYAPNRHIGVGIIRNLVGTVNTDRVNGGILATTSFFTKPAREFILENNWNCQIKMHDYNTVQELLNKAVAKK